MIDIKMIVSRKTGGLMGTLNSTYKRKQASHVLHNGPQQLNIYTLRTAQRGTS